MAAALIDLVVLAFAAWTLLCHGAVFLGGGLTAVLWAAALCAGAAALRLRRLPVEVSAAEPRWDRALWALAVLCAGVVLVSHRPDTDDALYLGIAAGVADFPGAPLLKADTLYGIPGLPILLSTYRFHSIEALYGAASYVLGLSVLAACHLVLAPLWGFLAPLAWARLFRVLSPERWFWGVSATVGYLLLDGSAHGGWGNLAFVRIFQGKAVFLTVMAPLVTAYGLRFGQRPTLPHWLLLAASLVASAGLSSSGLWASLLLAAVAVAATWRPDRDGLRAAGGAAAAALYPLAVALVLRAGVKDGAMGALQLAPGKVGVLLAWAFDYVAGPGPHRWALAALALAAPVLAPAGLARRWALLTGGVFLFLYNPLLGPWTALNLTSPSNFYRVFWLLPLPAFAGLAALAAADPVGERWRRGLGTALLLAALVPSKWALSQANGVRLGWPGFKMPVEFSFVQEVNAALPRGRVLGPTEVSQWLVTERGHAYPLLVKEIFFDEIHRHLTEGDLARRRALMDHVGGERPARLGSPEFRAGLKEYAPGGVVLYAPLPWAAEIRGDLAAAGYAPRLSRFGYELWMLDGSGGPAYTSP